MYLSGDACRYVLARPASAPPGQQFFYSTGALALVSAIVHKATGQPLDEFARTNLFVPLGIAGELWDRIGRDTDAGGGLRMRPRDMAKIGQLVLGGGRWNDRQIVSEGWIDASTAQQMKATDDEGYGYLWWTGRSKAGKRMVDWAGAIGRGGQSIRVVPELDLVVVVTAGYYQDYSPQAFATQHGVFNDVLRATSFPR
jgi:CubicO group peptidase (beta-lactamase class C family)